MKVRSTPRKTLIMLLASATVGIFPLLPLANAADNQLPTPAASAAESPLMLPQGFKAIKLDGDDGIKSGLVKVTERGVTKGDFNKLLAELSTQDKEHAREFKGVDQNKLDTLIGDIQTAWKAKYGQDFSIDDKNLVFDRQFTMAEFEVTDPGVAMNNFPVNAYPNEAATAADHSPGAGDMKKEESAAGLSSGRKVALVRIPAMTRNMPELTVSMIREGMMFWRVDVPNDRTGEQIYNDLLNQLNYIHDHQDKWPTDVHDAYRHVARHVLSAVYGVPLPGQNG